MAQMQIFIIDENETTNAILHKACMQYPTKPEVTRVQAAELFGMLDKVHPFLIILALESDVQGSNENLSKRIRQHYNIPILHILPEKFSDSQFKKYDFDYNFYLKHPLLESEILNAIDRVAYTESLRQKVDSIENKHEELILSPTYYCRFDLEGNILYANRQFYLTFCNQDKWSALSFFEAELAKHNVKLSEVNLTKPVLNIDSVTEKSSFILTAELNGDGLIECYLAIGWSRPHVSMNQHQLDDKYLFQLLLDNIPDGVYFKDTNSRFIKVNQAQAKLIGLKDPGEAVGKSDFDFFKHANEAYEDELTIMETGVPIINKIEKISTPEKAHAWMSATKVPIRERNGNVIGTMGLSRDVTELIENQKNVLKQEKNFQSLISNLPEAIVVYDFKKIIFCNEFTSQITGFQDCDIMGQDIKKFIAPHYHDKIETDFAKLSPDMKFPPFQVELVDRMGKLIPANFSAAVINYHNQQAVLIVIHDLRALKKRETELEQAKEQLEKMNTSLVESMDELRRFNEVMMAREGRVLELKKEINNILSQKKLPKKYTTAGKDDTEEAQS